MPTQTRQGGSVKGALFLIAILGIAALIVSVKGTPHRVEVPPATDNEEIVTLSVVFKPTPRKVPIAIRASVEGVQVVDMLWFKSPYSQPLRIPKGARVLLSATQEEQGQLDCIIMTSAGIAKPDGANNRPGIGSVRCYHNRPPGPVN